MLPKLHLIMFTLTLTHLPEYHMQVKHMKKWKSFSFSYCLFLLQFSDMQEESVLKIGVMSNVNYY